MNRVISALFMLGLSWPPDQDGLTYLSWVIVCPHFFKTLTLKLSQSMEWLASFGIALRYCWWISAEGSGFITFNLLTKLKSSLIDVKFWTSRDDSTYVVVTTFKPLTALRKLLVMPKEPILLEKCCGCVHQINYSEKSNTTSKLTENL